MIYNLAERATLYEDPRPAGEASSARREVAAGTLRELIALALSWDEERFRGAHIVTANDAAYGPEMIEEIGATEDIEADDTAGHPS